MITDERLTAFINSLDTGNPAYLNELERKQGETNVPIIRTEDPEPVKDTDIH